MWFSERKDFVTFSLYFTKNFSLAEEKTLGVTWI